jgi:hypothetical protein
LIEAKKNPLKSLITDYTPWTKKVNKKFNKTLGLLRTSAMVG